MIEIEDRPLEWYVDALKRKEYFSFPRFGDGEWFAIIRGGGTMSARLQKIDHKIQRDMTEALLRFASTPGIVFGMQRNVMRRRRLRESVTRFVAEHKLGISWVLADVLHFASRDGLLYPLLEQLRKMKVVVIGPCFLLSGQNELFNYHAFVGVPPRECYSSKAQIMSDILSIHRETSEDMVYSFSCGLLAETLILELHERMSGNFLIDVGSLWDVFCGRRSRGYTMSEKYTDDIMKRNLAG